MRGELARELGVVLRLTRIEARVLEQADPLVRQELPQPFLHRLHGERGILALRPPQVRTEDELGRIAVEEQLEGGQSRADPGVVGDARRLERHVEVDPDEDALAPDVGVANRAGQVHYSRRCTRSTSRQL